MYNPFKLSEPTRDFTEQFSLNMTGEKPSVQSIFTEAVFVDGRKTLQPVVDEFQKIKDLLDERIESDGAKFNGLEFLRDLKFKSLEDVVTRIFGFRNVNVFAIPEKYDSRNDSFSSNEFNCFTYPTWRFPIDGLVTDKGFYDSTHSINTEIQFTLSLLRSLTAEECTAIFLHEMGHNIDPAIVDITYTKTNDISKYLTDRKGKTEGSKGSSDDNKKGICAELVTFLVFIGLIGLFKIIEKFRQIFFNDEKAIQKIRNMISHDKDKFDRHSSAEAFADNFPRMYGLGPALISSFNKMNSQIYGARTSRYKREKARQRAIADMIITSIWDEHKTDIHRVNNIIKEYEADLNDPKIPTRVKKDIQEDLNEVKLVLDKYLNERSDFENKVNQAIYSELGGKIDSDITDGTDTNTDNKNVVDNNTEDIKDAKVV